MRRRYGRSPPSATASTISAFSDYSFSVSFTSVTCHVSRTRFTSKKSATAAS